MKFIALNLLLISTAAIASTTKKNLDVLFVIDNSGSMLAAQKQTCAHSVNLLKELKRHRINYRIGVTTTDTWKAGFNENFKGYLRLRDGHGETRSGVHVITPNTKNAEKVLEINLAQGIMGSGDERAFDSALQAISASENSDFRRQNVPLAVVVLSDEDDFTATTYNSIDENYESPLIVPIGDLEAEFRKLARRLSVSTISILDEACLSQMHLAANIGHRYNALADRTRGVKASLCDIPSGMSSLTKHLIQFAYGKN